MMIYAEYSPSYIYMYILQHKTGISVVASLETSKVNTIKAIWDGVSSMWFVLVNAVSE